MPSFPGGESGRGFPVGFAAVTEHAIAHIGLDYLTQGARLKSKFDPGYRFEQQTAPTASSVFQASSLPAWCLLHGLHHHHHP